MSRSRRMTLGLVDQILSSASNVLVVFAVARTSSVREFGSIALTLMLVTTGLAICRGSFGTPLLLGGPDLRQTRSELSGATTGALGLGVVIAIAALMVGTVLHVEGAAL